MYVSSFAKPHPNQSGNQVQELLNAGMVQNIYAIALEPADVDTVLSAPEGMYVAIDPKRPEAANRVLERQDDIKRRGLWVAVDSFVDNMASLQGFEGKLALEWLPPQDPHVLRERAYIPNHIIHTGRERFRDAEDVRLLIDVSHGILAAVHHVGTGHHINKYPCHDPERFPVLPQFPKWGFEEPLDAYPVTFPPETSEWLLDTLSGLDHSYIAPFAHVSEQVYALDSLEKQEANARLAHVLRESPKAAYIAPFNHIGPSKYLGLNIRRHHIRYATLFSAHIPLSGIPGQNIHYPGDLFANGNVNLTSSLAVLQDLGIETILIETPINFKKEPILRADADLLATHLRKIPSSPRPHRPKVHARGF